MAKQVTIHNVIGYDHTNGKVILNDVVITAATEVMTVTETPTGKDLGNLNLADGTLSATPVDQSLNA